MHCGHNNAEHSYTMGGNLQKLQVVTKEKDLEVLFTKDLKFSRLQQ